MKAHLKSRFAAVAGLLLLALCIAVLRWRTLDEPLDRDVALYAVMGRGCVSVTRKIEDGADITTGNWKDGRVGV